VFSKTVCSRARSTFRMYSVMAIIKSSVVWGLFEYTECTGEQTFWSSYMSPKCFNVSLNIFREKLRVLNINYLGMSLIICMTFMINVAFPWRWSMIDRNTLETYRVIKKSLCICTLSIVEQSPHIWWSEHGHHGMWTVLYWTLSLRTVRRVNKCLETGEGHFEHYL
jgi:hypothetical protein